MSYRNALIMGVIAGFFYFFSPWFDDGSALEKEITALRGRVAEQQAKAAESEVALKEVERIRKAVTALEEQFKQVSQQLPSEIVMSDIVRSVDQLARTSSVSVKDKEPRPTFRQDFLEIYPLRIRAEGTYSELTSFMYYLASTQRITRVKTFVFTAPASGPRGKLGFDGEVLSYRFVAPEPEKEKK